MPFEIPPQLLERLRARRREQREARAGRQPSAHAPNFIAALRRLFAGQATAAQAADQYVATMGTWQDEIETEHDAFLLDPGMGPMRYLTADGRILEDQRGWDGDEVVEVSGWRAHAALISGAQKTGMTELLELIPRPPAGSSVCTACAGARLAEPTPGFGAKLPCSACEARGWVEAGT